MRRSRRIHPVACAAATLLVLLAGVLPAAAVDPHGPARNSGSVLLGGFAPAGHSDRWEFNEEILNSDTNDYDDWALALGYQRQINNYLAVSGDLMVYDGGDRSTFRLDLEDFRQDTDLGLLPLTASIIWQPGGRYRSGGGGYPGKLRAVVPYIGAGIGVMFWEHETRLQVYSPLHQHYHRINRDQSDGAAPAAIARLGMEIPIFGPAALVIEGRYLWAHDEVDNDTFTLENDFLDVEDLDLGGAALLIGGVFRF